MHCPLFGGELEGKHFFLLSLVYVIDARTSNFRDTRSISGNGHTGNLSANKLSTHPALSEQSAALNCRQLTVISECMLGGWHTRVFSLMRETHKQAREVLP